MDPRFAESWQGSASVSLLRTAYHMLRFTASGQDQVKLFLQTVRLESGDIVPAVDVERNDPATQEERVVILADYIRTVEDALSRKMLIYVSPNFWKCQMGNSNQFASNPLWIADYGVERPAIPSPWNAWAFWQYTDLRKVSGITGVVDGDRFAGDMIELNCCRLP